MLKLSNNNHKYDIRRDALQVKFQVTFHFFYRHKSNSLYADSFFSSKNGFSDLNIWQLNNL